MKAASGEGYNPDAADALAPLGEDTYIMAGISGIL